MSDQINNTPPENVPLSVPSAPITGQHGSSLRGAPNASIKSLSSAEKGAESEPTDKVKQAQQDIKDATPGFDLAKEQKLYNGNGTRGIGTLNKIGGFIKRNPKKSGGVGFLVGLLTTVGLSGSLMLGPLQLTHFANMLTDIHFGPSESQTDIRTRKLIQYSKYIKNVNGFENTRLGTLEAFKANSVDKKLAKSGITSNFTQDGKFTGFELDDTKLPDDVQKDLEDAKNEKDPAKKEAKQKKAYSKHFKVSEGSIDLSGDKPKITTKGTREGRKLYSQALKISPDFHGNASALSKRVLIKRANLSYNPITRLKEGEKAKGAEKYRLWREERSQRLKGEDVNVPDAKPKEEAVDPEAEEVDKAKTNDFNDNQKKSAELFKKLKVPGSIAGGAAVAGGITTVVTAICMVKDTSAGIADMQLMARLTVAIQFAGEMISWPSKMMTGDFDIELMFQLVASLFSKDKGSAFGASTIKKETQKPVTLNRTSNLVDTQRTLDKEGNQQFNPDLDSNASKLSQLFTELPAAVGSTVDAVCKIMNTPGEWIQNSLNFITFGLSEAAMQNTVGKLMAWGMGALAGAAPVIVDQAGEVLGEEASIGARLMANGTEASVGAQVASTATARDARLYYQDYKYLNDERSLFAKIFDVQSIDSISGKALIATYDKPIIETVASIPKNSLLTFASFFGVAQAQGYGAEGYTTTDQDYYGIPMVISDPRFSDPQDTKFVTTDGQPIEFDNPYKVITEAQQRLKDVPGAKAYLEKCNQITIDDAMYATTKNADEGAAYNYMKKDGGCGEPIKDGTGTTPQPPTDSNTLQKPVNNEPKTPAETEFNKEITSSADYPNVLTEGLCTLDNSDLPSLKPTTKRLLKDCNDIYPKLEKILGKIQCKHINIKVWDESNPKNEAINKVGQGATAFVGGGVPGGECTYFQSANYVKNPTATGDSRFNPGILPHEMTHLFQHYTLSDTPGWITEGMASYMSYKFGYNYTAQVCSGGTDLATVYPYNCGANLLRYIERVYDPNFTPEIHKLVQQSKDPWKDNGGKDDAFIKSKTGGKTPQQLFEECQKPGNECVDNTTIQANNNKYLISNLPKYQSVAKHPSLTKTIAGIFNPSAVAEVPAQSQTIVLTPEQAAVAQTTMALTYTKEGMAYAALEENDDVAMKAMYDGNPPTGGKNNNSNSSSGSAKKYSGSKENLIADILSNSKLKLGASKDTQKSDIETKLTLTTLNGLYNMLKESGVEIPITSLVVDHAQPGVQDTGDHPAGKAIDIGYFGNGRPEHTADGDKLFNYLYDNYKELRISQLIWQDPPSGKKCIGNSGTDVKPVDCLEYYGQNTMNDHYHHIHVGFLPDE